jgi:hypothetical protein
MSVAHVARFFLKLLTVGKAPTVSPFHSKRIFYSIYRDWGNQAPIERKNYKVAAISRILV